MMTDFDYAVIVDSLPYLIGEGLLFTITLTAVATVGGLILGTLIAVMRLSRRTPLPQLAALYVNLLRALPLVLVIFLLYFLVPYFGQWLLNTDQPVKVGAYYSAFITFTLFEAAYFSEIMRAGIQSIPRGQIAAGQALGLSSRQVMVNIVLPQALRNMLPVIITQTIVLFQDTSLVYVLSLTDFLGAASKVAQREGRLTELYLFAAAVYFIVSFSASRLVARLKSHASLAAKPQ